MTDRRTHPVHACAWPDCAHVGQWRSPWCPAHHKQAMARLRMQVDAARRERLATSPINDTFDPCPPDDPQHLTLDVARDLLGATTQPEGSL